MKTKKLEHSGIFNHGNVEISFIGQEDHKQIRSDRHNINTPFWYKKLYMRMGNYLTH